MFKKLIFRIRDYFGFSKTEAEGVVVLFLIIAISLLLPLLINSFYKTEDITIGDQRYLDSLLANIKITNAPNQQEKKSELTPKKIMEREVFDPNIVTLNQLVAMGLSERLSMRIIKYRQKGGKFKKPEDLKKIYGFPENLYYEILPYIHIQTFENEPSIIVQQKKETKSISFTRTDINMADSSDLVEIKGIGPFTAAKVARYKEKLGGFVDTLQFYEIWGIDTARAEILSRSVEINKENIRKININEANAEALSLHPYIDWKKAKKIVEYRNQHGHYKSVEELILIKTIDQEWLEKVYPYLTTESIE